MGKKFKNTVWLLVLLIVPTVSNAQKDITQFLDIPVDGFKPEMIEKLKSKGFTVNRESEDILHGEFNGIDVNILIGTHNNKVWRIAVADAYPTNETNIKIRFNNLIQQFVNSKRYMAEEDSTIVKYAIPEDEDISYEITTNNKRYDAIFYQKSVKYDSLTKETELLFAKDSLNEKESERGSDLIVKLGMASVDSLYKPVWFMIKENYGEYRIVLYYENEYNKANGEEL